MGRRNREDNNDYLNERVQTYIAIHILYIYVMSTSTDNNDYVK